MRRFALLLCALLLLPTAALAQDADGDLFETADGDCDDGDSTAYPGATETCDGVDDDCDGTIDEPGAVPFQCDPNPILVETPDNSINGNLIILTEKFVPSVDFTGIPLWQDTLASSSTTSGVETNVHSLLVRLWHGSSSQGTLGNAVLTFPAGVTVLGWVIDFGTTSSHNRNLDATFSVTGGNHAAPTTR